MNRRRLITHHQIRCEIQVHTEGRQIKTVAAKNTSDPMDLDSIGKNGKNSKNGSKGQSQITFSNKEVACEHGGQEGYLSAECWSNCKHQRGPRGGEQKGGKGNQRKAMAKERAPWNTVTKLRLWNNSRNGLSRALWTWHRLRNHAGDRTLILKVG